MKTAKSRERPLSLSLPLCPSLLLRTSALLLAASYFEIRKKSPKREEARKKPLCRAGARKGTPTPRPASPASQLATAQVKKERKEEEDVDIGQTRGRRAKVQFDDFFCGRPSVRRRRPLPLQSRRTLLPLADIAKVNLLRINSAWRCPEAKVAPCEDGS